MLQLTATTLEVSRADVLQLTARSLEVSGADVLQLTASRFDDVLQLTATTLEVSGAYVLLWHVLHPVFLALFAALLALVACCRRGRIRRHLRSGNRTGRSVGIVLTRHLRHSPGLQ